jgi:hypothetical protein
MLKLESTDNSILTCFGGRLYFSNLNSLNNELLYYISVESYYLFIASRLVGYLVLVISIAHSCVIMYLDESYYYYILLINLAQTGIKYQLENDRTNKQINKSSEHLYGKVNKRCIIHLTHSVHPASKMVITTIIGIYFSHKID